MRYWSVLLLLLVFNCSFAQDINHTLDSKLDVYKHYVGTIGGRPAVLDMRYGLDGGSNFGGSNGYYLDRKELFKIIFRNPSASVLPSNAVEYAGPEVEENERQGANNSETSPTWQVIISGNKIRGKRYNAAGADAGDIDLEEDYTGSYAMDVMRLMERATVSAPKAEKCTAKVFAKCVKPHSDIAGPDADFISKVLVHFCGGDTMGVNKWEDYSKVYAQKYFGRIRKSGKNLVTDTFKENNGYSASYESYLTVFPAFNENGILVLELERMDRGGAVGDKSNFAGRYLCLDVRQKKMLQLSAILTIDSAKISALLTAEVRRKFKIPANRRLSTNTHEGDAKGFYSHFIVDAIPVTNNILVTHYGITFSYPADEVNTGGWEDLKLFLSYEQLRDLLKDDFKKRMGL